MPFVIHNFRNYDFHPFFKKLFNQKNDKLRNNSIPKTNQESFSVTYGCIRFTDSYKFLSYSLDESVENLNNDDFISLKKESPDKWEFLNEKLAYPNEFFDNIDDYQKPVNDLKKEALYSNVRNFFPDDSEMKRTITLLNYLIRKYN